MDRESKKEYLTTLIKQSALPTSKLNTVKMKYEEIDLEKVAEFLLDNGVDIHEYDVDEFVEHFCRRCGSQRCEGIGTEWWVACKYADHLKTE